MQATKITLEDKGQDFTSLIVSDKGKVLEARPFQTSIWKGAYIPITVDGMVQVGKLCPIHNPPHINYGHLKYKIERIEQIEYQPKTKTDHVKESKETGDETAIPE